MFSAVVLGIAQGARHSIEPDHLAAVSVLVGESHGALRSAWLGAVWGLGHTLSLAAMGFALACLGTALPPAADQVFALLVAAVLVALGVRSLWEHAHERTSTRPVRSPLQALLVGMIHGLAGSSALTAVAFVAMPTPATRVIYMVVFGLGSVLGMALVSTAAGAWIERARRPWLSGTLRITIGVFSIAIGVFTAIDAVLR